MHRRRGGFVRHRAGNPAGDMEQLLQVLAVVAVSVAVVCVALLLVRRATRGGDAGSAGAHRRPGQESGASPRPQDPGLGRPAGPGAEAEAAEEPGDPGPGHDPRRPGTSDSSAPDARPPSEAAGHSRAGRADPSG